MSIFKTREWWSTSCGDGEEFDHGCLAVGNVDNAADGSIKIVTGSLSGTIRVYAPKTKEYGVDDLVLELELKLPILQIEIGKFVPLGGRTAVALLHPRKLAVYTLDNNGTTDVYHQFRLEYEHRLEHTGATNNLLSNQILCSTSTG